MMSARGKEDSTDEAYGSQKGTTTLSSVPLLRTGTNCSTHERTKLRFAFSEDATPKKQGGVC